MARIETVPERHGSSASESDTDPEEIVTECLTTALLAGDYPDLTWPQWFVASDMASILNLEQNLNDRALEEKAREH